MNAVRRPRGRDVRQPLRTSRAPTGRSQFLLGALALAFLALLGRAAYVQVVNNGFFQNKAERRIVERQEVPANRGRILDRNGLLLASSVPVHSIWGNPRVLRGATLDKRQQEAYTRLPGLLDLTPEEFNKRLNAKENNPSVLQDGMDELLAKQVAALGIPGIEHRVVHVRKYPEGAAAAHVVGVLYTDSKKGQAGAELVFDRLLTGQAGSRRVFKDQLGRVVGTVGEAEKPVDGQDIHLSIDSKIQFFAYQKLREAVQHHKARAGSAVVLDAQTGEALALASYPSYDPENRRGLSSTALQHPALSAAFEPGSVMKPVTAAMSLETGRVTPRTVIDTSPGTYRLGTFTISDTRNYGALTVEGVVQKSSNVGSIKLAQRLTPQQMWETYSTLGFGRKPDFAFPDVATGRLRHWKNWHFTEQATMSYGYGLSASLFQMAHAYTAFAGDGHIKPATLVKVDDAQAQHPGVPVFSAKTTQAVRRMLALAAGTGGTGRLAQTVGYSMGGKTGTARKQEGKTYSKEKYRTWFVGMAPIEKPRIVVAVMIDEPRIGGAVGGLVAAPVFSEVAQNALRIMKVQPDLAITPGIVSAQVQGGN